MAGGREKLFGMAQHILSGFFTFWISAQGTGEKLSCQVKIAKLLWLLCPWCDPNVDGTAEKAAGPSRANTALET